MAVAERRSRRSDQRMPGPEDSSTYLSRPAPPPGTPSAQSEGSLVHWSFLSAEQPGAKPPPPQRQPNSGPMRQPPPPPPPPRGKRPPPSSSDGGGSGGAGFGTVLLSIVLSAAATAGAMQWKALKDRFTKVPRQPGCSRHGHSTCHCPRARMYRGLHVSCVACFPCSGTRRLTTQRRTTAPQQHQATVNEVPRACRCLMCCTLTLLRHTSSHRGAGQLASSFPIPSPAVHDGTAPDCRSAAAGGGCIRRQVLRRLAAHDAAPPRRSRAASHQRPCTGAQPLFENR